MRITLVLAVFNYSVTAMLLRTEIFYKLIPPAKTTLVALALLGVFTLGGMLAYYLVTYNEGNVFPLENYDTSVFALLNPFLIASNILNVFSISHEVPLQSFGMIGWSIALVPLLAIWLAVRLYRFSPKIGKNELTYDKAVEIVKAKNQQ